jgi:hypothetical protein
MKRRAFLTAAVSAVGALAPGARPAPAKKESTGPQWIPFAPHSTPELKVGDQVMHTSGVRGVITKVGHTKFVRPDRLEPMYSVDWEPHAPVDCYCRFSDDHRKIARIYSAWHSHIGDPVCAGPNEFSHYCPVTAPSFPEGESL